MLSQYREPSMKQLIRSLLAWTAILSLQAISGLAAALGVIAIRNARVVTVSGPDLPRATVVIRDGLIEAVGESVIPPAGTWVIEGEGLTVYPGLVSSLSTWGIPQAAPPAGGAGPREGGAPPPVAPSASSQQSPSRSPEDRPQTTSWLRAADEVRTSDTRLESARSAGFTTSVTFPTHGLISGHGAVINLAAENPRDMVLAPSAGLYLSLNTSSGFRSFPGSLMGVIAYIRQVWLDAGYYQIVKADYDKSPVGKQRPQYDRALDGVLEAHRVLLPATRAVEIDRMIRFTQELKMNAVLYGGHEAYKAASLLKKAGVPVLVNVTWPERGKEADPEVEESLQVLELRENAPSSPAALAKAGVRFAFYAADSASPRDFVKNVKKAIDAGLKQEDALRAMTLSAAEIFGVADRLGSIDKGKIADLLVTKGNLFQDGTKVEFIMIDGKKYEPAPAPPKPEGGPAQ